LTTGHDSSLKRCQPREREIARDPKVQNVGNVPLGEPGPTLTTSVVENVGTSLRGALALTFCPFPHLPL